MTDRKEGKERKREGRDKIFAPILEKYKIHQIRDRSKHSKRRKRRKELNIFDNSRNRSKNSKKKKEKKRKRGREGRSKIFAPISEKYEIHQIRDRSKRRKGKRRYPSGYK